MQAQVASSKWRAPVIQASSLKNRGTPLVEWGTSPLHRNELGTPGKHPVHRPTIAPPYKPFAIDTGACNKQRLDTGACNEQRLDTGACNEQRLLNTNNACATGSAHWTKSLLRPLSSFCVSAACSSCSWPLPDGSSDETLDRAFNFICNPSWR
jgi:hypothetical protein